MSPPEVTVKFPILVVAPNIAPIVISLPAPVLVNIRLLLAAPPCIVSLIVIAAAPALKVVLAFKVDAVSNVIAVLVVLIVPPKVNANGSVTSNPLTNNILSPSLLPICKVPVFLKSTKLVIVPPPFNSTS